MAKIYGLFGSMTGKMADVVMSVRYGEQIARKYQPIVSNPNTPAQIASRAKLKLVSQLSAVMAPVIAMPRHGSVSSRNMFVKANYQATTFTNNMADITLSNVVLTRSVVALPELQATREGTTLTVSLSGSLSGSLAVNLDRVVYAMFIKQTDGTLRYTASTVVTEPGNSGNFAAEFSVSPTINVIIYAYGVRDNTEAARVIFGNMQALKAEAVAKLIVSKTLLETDITLTETKAIASDPA